MQARVATPFWTQFPKSETGIINIVYKRTREESKGFI